MRRDTDIFVFAEPLLSSSARRCNISSLRVKGIPDFPPAEMIRFVCPPLNFRHGRDIIRNAIVSPKRTNFCSDMHTP